MEKKVFEELGAIQVMWIVPLELRSKKKLVDTAT
jgi:hypothetical protein